MVTDTHLPRQLHAPILRPGADFLSLLETMYDDDPDDASWAHRLLASLGGILGSERVGLVGVVHGEGFSNPTVVMDAATDPLMRQLNERAKNPDDPFALPSGDDFQNAYYPGHPVETLRELSPHMLPEVARRLDGYRAFVGAEDTLAIFAYPEPGMVVSIWVPFDHILQPSRLELGQLHRVAAHLDSALRLRTRPDLVIAGVVSPAGKWLDRDTLHLQPKVAAALAVRVSGVERALADAGRRDPVKAEIIDAWSALVAGRFSVIPREDRDGKRYYLVVFNPTTSAPHARFSPRESEVVRAAARGFSGKDIAYTLGLSPATVSTALGSAAVKVGLRSRTALVQVASALFGARGPALDLTALTPAERDVLELVRRGMTNAEIARLRERASRTVANQVASLLLKTGATSRRVLGIPRDGRG